MQSPVCCQGGYKFPWGRRNKRRKCYQNTEIYIGNYTLLFPTASLHPDLLVGQTYSKKEPLLHLYGLISGIYIKKEYRPGGTN